MAGDHWAGVGVLVAAKEGAWLLRPSRAPEKVALIFVFDTKSTFLGLVINSVARFASSNVL